MEDFDINNQEKFVNILESSKKIGLSLTNSLMLVRTKSVTAVMGITENEEKCHIKGCEVCTRRIVYLEKGRLSLSVY